MLDFSWAELLLVVAVAVLVIGPDEIPEILRSLGRIVRRLQYVRFALSQQFDDFMKDHDLDELRAESLLRDESASAQAEKDADGGN